MRIMKEYEVEQEFGRKLQPSKSRQFFDEAINIKELETQQSKIESLSKERIHCSEVPSRMQPIKGRRNESAEAYTKLSGQDNSTAYSFSKVKPIRNQSDIKNIKLM